MSWTEETGVATDWSGCEGLSLIKQSTGLIIREDFAAMADGASVLPSWTAENPGAYILGGALNLPMGITAEYYSFSRPLAVQSGTVWQVRQSYPVEANFASDRRPGINYGFRRDDAYWGMASRGANSYWMGMEQFSNTLFNQERVFYEDLGNTGLYPLAAQQNTYKLQYGSTSHKLWWPNNVMVSPANIIPTTPDTVLLETFFRSGSPEFIYKVYHAYVYSSNIVTCSYVPEGLSFQILDVGDDVVAEVVPVAGVAIWDADELPFPFVKVRLVNEDGEAVHSLTPSDGVWGGDHYIYGT